ncbi:hypothetical protein [Paraferrimonas sp. SM1919]|uniref:hypothetical protein n=1 Tax=Paraferrimonas sp. SM1919 TaxID=2662263 RepID=UPI0013D6C4BE|nr:hypothetical protein [Paraferrimonas sp. SM1919]
MTNWSPKEVSCNDLAEQPSAKDWVILKDCEFGFNYTYKEVTEESKTGNNKVFISKFYLPFYKIDSEADAKPLGYVIFDSKKDMGHIEKISRLETEEEVANFFDTESPAKDFYIKLSETPLQGMNLWGVLDWDNERDYFSGETAHAGFLMIEPNEQPMAWYHWLMFLVCWGIVVLIIWGMTLPDEPENKETESEPQ